MGIFKPEEYGNNRIKCLVEFTDHDIIKNSNALLFSSHVMLYLKFCIMVVSLRCYNDADYGVIRITIIMQMHIKDRIPDIVPQIIGYKNL